MSFVHQICALRPQPHTRSSQLTHYISVSYSLWPGWPWACSTGMRMPGGHLMRFTTRSFAAALMFVLLGTTLASAQQKKSQAQPLSVATTTAASDQLVITSATVNRTSQTLMVQGLAFGNQPPQVWLETQPMTVISATSTQLVVFLPAAVPDG